MPFPGPPNGQNHQRREEKPAKQPQSLGERIEPGLTKTSISLRGVVAVSGAIRSRPKYQSAERTYDVRRAGPEPVSRSRSEARQGRKLPVRIAHRTVSGRTRTRPYTEFRGRKRRPRSGSLALPTRERSDRGSAPLVAPDGTSTTPAPADERIPSLIHFRGWDRYASKLPFPKPPESRSAGRGSHQKTLFPARSIAVIPGSIPWKEEPRHAPHQ